MLSWHSGIERYQTTLQFFVIPSWRPTFIYYIYTHISSVFFACMFYNKHNFKGLYIASHTLKYFQVLFRGHSRNAQILGVCLHQYVLTFLTCIRGYRMTKRKRQEHSSDSTWLSNWWMAKICHPKPATEKTYILLSSNFVQL